MLPYTPPGSYTALLEDAAALCVAAEESYMAATVVERGPEREHLVVVLRLPAVVPEVTPVGLGGPDRLLIGRALGSFWVVRMRGRRAADRGPCVH